MPIVNQEMAARFVKQLESAWKCGLVKLTEPERHFMEGAWHRAGNFTEKEIWYVIGLMQYYGPEIEFDCCRTEQNPPEGQHVGEGRKERATV